MDTILWLVAFLVLLVVEAACPFHLVSIWFAVGALSAMIVALLSGAVWLQVLVFFVVSCGLLVALLPLVRKFVTPKIVKTNIDSVIGSRGYVTADIDNLSATGKVKLGGMEWTARSESGEKIPAGTLVQVQRIEGVKAFVQPVEAEIKEVSM
ncbi:MAG: NfeD family protein [Oscillospiraceae bacterium]|nr:NfeD family protein [Oscillospiraceae bacterium]